jgi:RNA polymerase sigma-70 factor (ECF subfamily)
MPIGEHHESSHTESQGLAVDDAVLIRHFQDGCVECFGVLFHRHCKMAFAIAWKVLRQREQVEDVVQEVFLSIYLKRTQYDPARGSVKTWIGQFSHFKAMTVRRLLARHGQEPLEDALQFELYMARDSSNLDSSERTTLIRECLDVLNARQRRVIEAVHLQGFTLDETARSLNESLANTRNLYYRGISSIRKYVQAPPEQNGRSHPAVAFDVEDIFGKVPLISTEL